MQDKRRHIRNIESKEPKVIWSLIEKKKRGLVRKVKYYRNNEKTI